MKKIRIISLMLVVLMLALALASCGGYQKLGDIYKGEYIDNSPAYTAAKELSAVAGATFIDLEGDLALFSKLDGTTVTYTVMNVMTEAVVGTYTSTTNVVTTVNLENAIDTVFYKVASVDSTNADNKTYSTKLYTMAGTEFAASTKEDVPYQAVADLVLLDEKVYRGNEDGSFTEAFDRPAYAGALPNATRTDGEYYYQTTSYCVYTYDKEMNLLAVIRKPSYATELPSSNASDYFLLGDGNVMMQYVVILPEDAQDYDIVYNGTKYDLVTVIADAKDGDQKEIDSDYYFYSITSYSVYSNGMTYADAEKAGVDLDAIAMGYEIVDQHIVIDRDEKKFLALSSNGKVEGALDENIDGQYGPASRVNADYYMAMTKDGKQKLLDKNSDVIADVSDAEMLLENMIVCEDAIYDYNLNEIYNLKTNKMTLVEDLTVYGGSVVFMQDEEKKIYVFRGPNADGTSAAPELIDGDDSTYVYTCSIGYYVVNNSTYTYYNNAGAKLFEASEYADLRTGEDYHLCLAGDKVFVVK